MVHWYAMKILVSDGQEWDQKYKVFSGNTRRQAEARARTWAKESGLEILGTTIYSFDSEDGANWQCQEWEEKDKEQ